MSAQPVDDEPPPLFCRTVMNYVARDADDGEDTTPVEVAIRDGRRAALPGWQECGFELLAHDAAVDHWDDDEAISEVHYAEMAALARTLTGCDHALVASHIRRNPEQAARHADLGPIAFVHSDFAASYGTRIREFYRAPSQDAQRALARAGLTADVLQKARRLLILQFWRNTGPPRMDLPLGFCDARSIDADELRTIRVTDYAGGGFDFETLGVVAPERPGKHQWYAFPDLDHREVVVFRTYDSQRLSRGEPYWTPHSAFADPTVGCGRPSRRSIELRATCLFL